jgi:hypothetical protein
LPRIKKVADATDLSRVPILYRWQYIVAGIAVGTFEQFFSIDHNDPVTGVGRNEPTSQTRECIWLVVAKGDDPNPVVATRHLINVLHLIHFHATPRNFLQNEELCRREMTKAALRSLASAMLG